MIVVNQEDCIKCGACEGKCPSAAIQVTATDVVYCDTCGEDPKCVGACPNGALMIEDIELDEEGNSQIRLAFNPAKCDSCGDCIDVCPPKTLKLGEGKLPLEGFCVMCQECVNICPVDVIGIPGIKEPASRDIDIEGAIYISDCVGCNMCVDECPVDAITLSKYGGTIEIDDDTCIKCGVCSQTCPWNAVFISGKKPEKRLKDIKAFELDEDACIGCNSCLEACPGDFITAKESNLSVNLPDKCAACGLCENVCPVDAISLDVELSEAKPANEEGVVCDADKCDFIGACAASCPNEAIRVVTESGLERPGDIQVDKPASFSMCARCGACTVACPNGALTLSEIDKNIDGGIETRNRISYNPAKCEECGTCVDKCPYDMLKLTEDKAPLKGFCVLCDSCIDACPKDALSLK